MAESGKKAGPAHRASRPPLPLPSAVAKARPGPPDGGTDTSAEPTSAVAPTANAPEQASAAAEAPASAAVPRAADAPAEEAASPIGSTGPFLPGSSTADRNPRAAPPSASRADGPDAHAIPTLGDRIGKYVVERLIGSGGMGFVLAARNEALEELVAIKLLRPKAAGDKIHAERFAREARAIIKIKSEHVVRVLDAGTLDSGVPYIVMEYLVGRDLAQILRKDGPMPPAQAADAMLQVCEAVASAHAVGVVHRDLKPSNFFVTQRTDGTTLVKVLDFGIAKAIGQEGVVDPNLTETQAVFGSPTYMSPEQIRSAKHVDHRSDIWSIGVGLYELLTGKLPFAGDNVAGLLASIVADPPYFPKAFAPDLPQELEDLLLACLMKDPRQRVQTVGELAVRLAAFATPNLETHNLVERIQRLSNATSPAVPTPGMPLPPGQPPGATTTTGPKLPPLAAKPSGPAFSAGEIAPTPPHPGWPQADARGSGGAFGSTGMDLSAEAPPPGGRGIFAGVAIGIAIATFVIVGVVGAYWFGTRRSPVQAAPRPPEVPTVAGVGSAPLPPVSSPAVADSAATSAAKPAGSAQAKKVPKHQAKPTASASTASAPASAPKPSDPTSDRF